MQLAGGKVPADRVIDGKDIWPLLAGQSKNSPHEALFYWEGMALAAVRSGEWKLLIRPQKEPGHQNAGATANRDAVMDFAPRLYHLDRDMGETTDLAAQNPEVVKRLQDQIAAMDKDLGIRGKKAPGVRAAGQVADPKPLLMRNGIEYD